MINREVLTYLSGTLIGIAVYFLTKSSIINPSINTAIWYPLIFCAISGFAASTSKKFKTIYELTKALAILSAGYSIIAIISLTNFM